MEHTFGTLARPLTWAVRAIAERHGPKYPGKRSGLTIDVVSP